MVEYRRLLALVAVVVSGALAALGGDIASTLDTVTGAL